MTTNDNSPQQDLLFGKFVIPSDSIFYKTEHSFAFVNLRPIVPGHVLVSPQRVVPLLEDLTEEECMDLFRTVRITQQVLKRHYANSTAFNVAIQDGRAAGQSVPHVHVHVLPRQEGDFERNDDVYDHLNEWAPREELRFKTTLVVADDGDRIDRTRQQMAEEAAMYRALFAVQDSRRSDGQL